MKHLRSRVLFLLALFLAGWAFVRPGSAPAAGSYARGVGSPLAVTLYPTEDASVNQNSPATNYGVSSRLYVRQDAAEHERFALLRFDFASIPPGSTIQSARFYAYLREGSGASPARLSMHWIVGNWTEDSVTWNNKPSTVLTGHFRDVATTAGWRNWDVTDMAQCWADRSALCTDAMLAMRVHPDFNDAFVRDFDSSEGEHRPYLSIDFTPPPTPTPTPTPTPVRCPDNGASDPNHLVRINVIVESARGSASLDGDNFLFDNYADLYPQVEINHSGWIDGPYVEGDDTPHFQSLTTVEVPRDIGSVPIRIRLWDRDAPDPNNVIDLDPTPGDRVLDLSFDLCAYAFTDDGASQGDDCPDGLCRGGVNHWLGPGDNDEHASMFVRIETGNGLPISDVAGDVAITGVDFVQIVNRPDVAVAGRGSILRVTMANTYPYAVDTTVRGYIGDAVGPEAMEEHDPVHINACESRTETFFVADPVVVDLSRARFGALIDPLGLLTPTGAPQCVRFNNGGASMGALPIHTTRDLSVIYQRIFHWDDRDWDIDMLSNAAAEAEAEGADARIEGFFPSPELNSLVDPIPLPIPFRDVPLGPRTEIQVLSETVALLGLDRVVGLVPNGWHDRHGYILLPEGTSGVSNGKIGPHFVYAESIAGENGFTPVHELGHTFGLSDEPCDSLILWECEDEYNGDAFPTRPAGGFPGVGFDVPQAQEAAGICFMDNEEDAWISNNDFESFVNKLAPGADPRILVVSGVVRSAGGGEITAAIGRPAGVADRDSRGLSPFALRVLSAAGATLGEYGIFADMQGEDEDHDGVLEPHEIKGDLDNNGIPDALPVDHPSTRDENNNGIADAAEIAEFTLRIPWPAGGESVALIGPHGEIYDTQAVLTTPLAIDLVEPVGAVQLQPGDLLPVRWRLPGQADASASLGVAIASSYDGGKTWLPRAARAQGNVFIIDARHIVGPINMRVEVLSLQNGMAGSDTVAGDRDGDRCPDPIDPSPSVRDTLDADGDAIPNVCDRCPTLRDPLQTDADQDGRGDACDADYNNDGRVNNTDFSQYFQPCVGADVVRKPECFDRDRDHNGTVTAGDFCTPAPNGLCDDGDPNNGLETCSPVNGCQPGVQPASKVWLPLLRR